MFFPVQQELGALVVLPAVPCPTPGCLQGRGTQLAGHSVRLSVLVEGKGREGRSGALAKLPGSNGSRAVTVC